jgi:hypothetical protein
MNKAIALALILIVSFPWIMINIRYAEAVGGGSAGVHSSSESVTNVQDHITIRNKDGSTITCSGKQTIETYDDKSGNAKVVVDPPSEHVFLDFTGSYITAFSTYHFVFRDGLGLGDSTVNISGNFSGKFDETENNFTAFNTVVYGPSVNFRNGSAETGPWSIYYDPHVFPIIGTWNLATGWFNITCGVWFDCPNLRHADNTPIAMIEHAWGTFAFVSPVGGAVVPVDKFGLLVPYIGLYSTILVATLVTAVYVKSIKRRKEKQ